MAASCTRWRPPQSGRQRARWPSSLPPRSRRARRRVACLQSVRSSSTATSRQAATACSRVQSRRSRRTPGGSLAWLLRTQTPLPGHPLVQDGCTGTLPHMRYMDCRLMASNCTLLPAVEGVGPSPWIKRVAGEALQALRQNWLSVCWEAETNAPAASLPRKACKGVETIAAAPVVRPASPSLGQLVLTRYPCCACRLPAAAATASAARLHHQTSRGAPGLPPGLILCTNTLGRSWVQPHATACATHQFAACPC